MTPLGSLDRWIEGSQTPKGHKHEIQHALGQRPGEFIYLFTMFYKQTIKKYMKCFKK